MSLQDLKASTLEILQKAENVYDKDAVFATMFTAGIPFTKIQGLYREVGTENGLLVDPVKAKEDITANLSARTITEFADYLAIEALAKDVNEVVGPVPEDLIMKTIRVFYREQEVVLPRAPREYSPRGPRGGKIVEALANYCHTTAPASLTRTDMYEVVRPHVKAARNAYDQVNSTFLLVYAIHNNLSYEGAMEASKEVPLLNLTELQAADE